MLKVQTVFCWIITCIVCVYFNFYAFSKVSSLCEAKYYQTMEKKYDDLNQRLSKETILKVNGTPDSIQNLFNVITSNDRINNPDFKEKFNVLTKNKTEEFLTILKTKKVMYTIQQSPSISDYLNKEGSQNPKLKELTTYLNEHIELNKNKLGSYSKEKVVQEIIKMSFPIFIIIICAVVFFTLTFGLIFINPIYSSVVILSTNTIMIAVTLFQIYNHG